MEDFWLKQTTDKPLFSDLIWSKPENKSHSGKLLIVGGSTNGFAHTVGCYTESLNAGAGSVRVLIPDSTKKLIGSWSEDIIYGPSTKSGGFGQTALSELNEASSWSDTMLLSGELGNNSETTILFEKFFEKYQAPLVVALDAFDLIQVFVKQLAKRANVTFILDLPKLQRLSIELGSDKPITSSGSLVNLVETLHEFTATHLASLVIEFNDFIVVASQGFVSTTRLNPQKYLQIKLATNAAVWYMQNQSKAFEALSCAAISCQDPN